MHHPPRPCVYCGIAPGTTADHVPPKAFFPKPRPSNLTTVPACLTCNNAASRDEEYFLAALMFSEAGITATGKKLWDEKLRRMYAKNLGLRRQMGKSMRPVELTTPAGIYLGRRLALGYNEQRLESIATKVVRGLYFLERGVPAPADWDLMCLFVRKRAHFEAASQHNHMLKSGNSSSPAVFQYRVGFVPEQPLKSLWLLWFWRTHIFWVTAKPAEPVTNNDG
jgi:hypothetical protein